MSGCVLQQKGQRVLIAAHGNSLRAMVKYLDNMTDDEIMALNIPTGAYNLLCKATLPFQDVFLKWSIFPHKGRFTVNERKTECDGDSR